MAQSGGDSAATDADNNVRTQQPTQELERTSKRRSLDAAGVRKAQKTAPGDPAGDASEIRQTIAQSSEPGTLKPQSSPSPPPAGDASELPDASTRERLTQLCSKLEARDAASANKLLAEIREFLRGTGRNALQQLASARGAPSRTEGGRGGRKRSPAELEQALAKTFLSVGDRIVSGPFAKKDVPTPMLPSTPNADGAPEPVEQFRKQQETLQKQSSNADARH